MANWQVISLDTTTPQLRAPGTGDGYSFNSGSTQLGVWTTTGLGIGTATPQHRLDVAYDANATSAARVSNSNLGSSATATLRLDTQGNTWTINSGRNGGFLSFSDSGGERARFDSSGNLGIGTASPGQRLEVNGNIAVGGSLGTTPSLNRGIYVQSNTNNDVVGYSLYVNDGANNRRGSMFLDDATGLWGWDVTSSSGTPSYVWRVANAEVMRLNDSGNLGIGTTSPVAKLQSTGGVLASGAVAATVANAAVMDFSGGLTRFWATGSNTSTQGSMVFVTASSNASVYNERMLLDSSGNLGLGVTPSAWDTSAFRALQVGSGPGSAALFGRTDNANNVGLSVNYYYGAGNTRYIANGTASYYNQQNGIHSWHIAPSNTSGAGAIASFTQAMTLNASGNLLVGTTSAYGKLTVLANTNGANDVWVRNESAGSSSQCGLVLNASGNSWRMGMGSTANNSNALTWNIDVQAANTELMRLTTSGNLGIGTASPAQKLDVRGGSIVVDTAAAGLNPTVFFDHDNFASGTRNYIQMSRTTEAMLFGVANADRMTIDASGNLGLNVTPSAWAGKAFQIGNASNSGWASIGYDANGKGFFATTAYNNSGSSWTYTATGFAATLYSADSGAHKWYTAPSGTAGNPISFGDAKMTLDASGNLSVKTTTSRANITTDADLVTQNGIGVLATSTTYGQGSQYIRLMNSAAAYAGGISQTASTGIGLYSAGDLILGSSSTERARIPAAGGMVVGTAALATTATDGFLYIPGCAGTPTGTPTAYTGRVPLVVDTTNNKLYFYSGGAWRDAGP